MVRLHEKQLHIMTALLVLVSVALFFFLAMPELKQTESISFQPMSNFSEGWICKYSSTKAEVLKKYYSEEDILAGKNKVEEIFQLPFELEIEEGKKLELTNRIPKMVDNQNAYMQLETNAQKIAVYIGKDCIYKSSELDDQVKAIHLIEIPSKYQESIVKIVLKEEDTDKIKVAPIMFGSDSQVLVEALKKDGAYFIGGTILLLLSVCIFALRMLMKTQKERKQLLGYVELEGIVIALLGIFQSRLIRCFTGWNYSIDVAKASLILVLIAMHLLVIRYVLSHKKVCFFVDMGMVITGILFVSVTVLTIFGLISFATIYKIGIGFFILFAVLYVLLLLPFSGKQGTLDIWWIMTGNIVLVVAFAAYFVVPLIQRVPANPNILAVAFLVYAIITHYRGLKKATFEKMPEQEKNDENSVRMQVVEQMNPNLIFASLHTLQKMVKKNSENSIKMLYYISAYFRSNLLALENQDEIISFEQELEHIIAYLQLQKSRNQDLNYMIECKEKNFWIPRNSIEPIVENAVKYGIGGNQNRGNVVVRSYQRNDGYAIQIIDDGAGFDVNSLKRSASKTSLLHLFDNLKQYCKANIEVVSKEGKGTVVTLVLPMLDNDLLQERQDGGKDE